LKIVMGSDKSGFILKESVKEYLINKGIEVEDLGTQNVENPMPFFEVAPVVAKKVAKEPGQKAILICGTGMGMSQVANMFDGVYAACCESVYAARMCRAINNSNILCMGGWVIGPEMGIEMADAFLHTEFMQGLEEWRQKFLKNAAEKVHELSAQTRKKV
jgi:ribose 5-phosphate isomerase B